MGDIIYHIQCQKGHYIGELVDTNFLLEHWRNCQRNFISGDKWQSPNFEKPWRDYVFKNGMNCETFSNKPNFIIKTASADVSTLYQKLAKQFSLVAQDIIEDKKMKSLKTNWLDVFQQAWNLNNTIAVEACLICLGYKQFGDKLLNKQVAVSMGAEEQEFFNGSLTPQAVDAKLGRLVKSDEWTFSLPRTITLENYKSASKKLQKLLNNYKKKFKVEWKKNKSGSLYITVDIVKWPEFRDIMDPINTKIADIVSDEYVKSFKDYCNKFNKKSRIYEKLDDIYNTILHDTEIKTRSDLIKTLNKKINENNISRLVFDYLKKKNFRKLSISMFCDIYNTWYKRYHFSGYHLKENTLTQLTSVKNTFQKFFTKWIQDNVFSPMYDMEYQTFSINQWEKESLEMDNNAHYTKQYRYYKDYLVEKYNYSEDFHINSWRNKILSSSLLTIDFLKQYWIYIYREQVSYWLKKAHWQSLVISHRSQFEDLWPANEANDKITIY